MQQCRPQEVNGERAYDGMSTLGQDPELRTAQRPMASGHPMATCYVLCILCLFLPQA